MLAEALALTERTDERLYEAELHRLRGELLLQGADRADRSALPGDEAEASFRQAIAIARRQKARSLELRAALSLTRLQACLGQRSEALASLADVFDWFTEGQDTPDLREARALLEGMS